jgi:hypothetical protein
LLALKACLNFRATQAPSPEKALSGIRKVVADVVEEMTASGESVPLWFTEPLQPKPPNKA